MSKRNVRALPGGANSELLQHAGDLRSIARDARQALNFLWHEARKLPSASEDDHVHVSAAEGHNALGGLDNIVDELERLAARLASPAREEELDSGVRVHTMRSCNLGEESVSCVA